MGSDFVRDNYLQEDRVKEFLDVWLQERGWNPKIAWGHERGADIAAVRSNERWVIEVKGCGSRPQMRANYFLLVLGQMLQRMEEPEARYSVAFPDVAQFRGLWSRLPDHAKQLTAISALFVGPDGQVREEN